MSHNLAFLVTGAMGWHWHRAPACTPSRAISAGGDLMEPDLLREIATRGGDAGLNSDLHEFEPRRDAR